MTHPVLPVEPDHNLPMTHFVHLWVKDARELRDHLRHVLTATKEAEELPQEDVELATAVCEKLDHLLDEKRGPLPKQIKLGMYDREAAAVGLVGKASPQSEPVALTLENLEDARVTLAQGVRDKTHAVHPGYVRLGEMPADMFMQMFLGTLGAIAQKMGVAVHPALAGATAIPGFGLNPGEGDTGRQLTLPIAQPTQTMALAPAPTTSMIEVVGTDAIRQVLITPREAMVLSQLLDTECPTNLTSMHQALNATIYADGILEQVSLNLSKAERIALKDHAQKLILDKKVNAEGFTHLVGIATKLVSDLPASSP